MFYRILIPALAALAVGCSAPSEGSSEEAKQIAEELVEELSEVDLSTIEIRTAEELQAAAESDITAENASAELEKLIEEIEGDSN